MPEPGALGGGVTAGYEQTQLDLQAVQMGQYKLQEAPIKLAQEGIQLQQDKIALQKEMTMLSLMKNIRPGQGGDTPDGMAGLMNQFAEIAMLSGKPDEGAKIAQAASGILSRSSQIDYRTYRQQTDRMARFANILGQVPDTAAGWAAAVQAMQMQDPGVMQDQRFASMAQRPWQLGMVPGMKAASITAKDQAEITYREKVTERQGTLEAVDRARIPLIAAETKAADARADHLAKVGGVVLKASDRKAIISLAKSAYPYADDADIYNRATAVAEDMRRMMNDQHLPESEAAIRAFQHAKEMNVWAGMRQGTAIKGTTPGRPLDLPDISGKVKDNLWYVDPKKFGDDEPRLAKGGYFWTKAQIEGDDDESKGDEVFDESPEAQARRVLALGED